MKPKILIVILVLGALFAGAGFFLYRCGSEPGWGAAPAGVVPTMDLAALQASAGQGDPAAQTRLARIFLEGTVTNRNIKEAVKWLRQETNQDYPDALAAWGELTQAGQGVPKNLAEAVRVYQSAGEKGSVAAQYDLAFLYEQGSGVKKDRQQAAKWYQLAAEGGDPLAQFDIGQRYALGVGVTTNRVEAFKWLALAAAAGQPDSAKLLSELKRQMSGDELTQAAQLVRQFSPRTANPAH